MKFVADQDIPKVAAAVTDLAAVELLPGREIGPGQLRDCNCLIMRSVTRVDAALLAGSAVEFIASATTGICRDQAALRAGIGLPDETRADWFDSLPRIYPDRVEYARCRLRPRPPWLGAEQLERMGFGVAA